MFPRLLTVVALALWLAGCGDDETSVVQKTDPTEVSPACDDGFAYDEPAEACLEVAAGDCPPGSTERFGMAQCVDVGWTGGCPDGMTAHPSGWGCAATAGGIESCPGATRWSAETGSCVPVGDCSAAFPPADAAYFVDDSFTDAELDATHFRSIVEATTAAAPSSVIAVEAGNYQGVIRFDKPLTVVGRCPEQVVVTPSGGPYSGLYVFQVDGAKASGLTLSGFPGGVLMEGGTLELRDVVITDNNTVGMYMRFDAVADLQNVKISGTTYPGGAIGAGLVVYDTGHLTISDATLTDNIVANLNARGDAVVHAERLSIARNLRIDGSTRAGILIEEGATVNISDSQLFDCESKCIEVTDGSTATVDRTVIQRSHGTVGDGDGVGIFGNGGSSLTLTQSVLSDHPGVGAYVDGEGSSLTIDRSVVRTEPGFVAEFGRGAQATTGATMNIEGSAFINVPQSGIGFQFGAMGSVRDTLVSGAYPVDEGGVVYGGFGVLIENGSQVTVQGATLVDNTLSGLSVTTGAVGQVSDTIIRRTRELPVAGIGAGCQVSAGAVLIATRTVFSHNAGAGLMVALDAASAELSQSIIRDTALNAEQLFGHGIIGFTSTSVSLSNTSVVRNVGVGLVADGSTMRVFGGTFGHNAIGLHAQSGSFLVESDEENELTSGEVRVSSNTTFVANGAKVGSGVVAVPSPL